MSNLPCCSGKLSRKEPNFVTSGGNLHYYVTFWQKRKQSDFPNARCRFPKSDWTLRIGMYTVGDISFLILESKIWPIEVSNIDRKNLLIIEKKTKLLRVCQEVSQKLPKFCTKTLITIWWQLRSLNPILHGHGSFYLLVLFGLHIFYQNFSNFFGGESWHQSD